MPPPPHERIEAAESFVGDCDACRQRGVAVILWSAAKLRNDADFWNARQLCRPCARGAADALLPRDERAVKVGAAQRARAAEREEARLDDLVDVEVEIPSGATAAEARRLVMRRG